MGLRQREQRSRPPGHWLVPALMAGLAVALQAGGESARQALQYDKSLIARGELSRLVTGHFVHLGWPHLFLNLAGLLLVWILAGAGFGLWQWLGILLASTAAVDLGFWLLVPRLEWYVGLSGVLHGLLAGGIAGVWSARRNEARLLAAVLAAKLLYEGFVGPMPGSEQSAGGPVITSAHLFGAMGGGSAGLIIVAVSKHAARR